MSAPTARPNANKQLERQYQFKLIRLLDYNAFNIEFTNLFTL